MSKKIRGKALEWTGAVMILLGLVTIIVSMIYFDCAFKWVALALAGTGSGVTMIGICRMGR